MAKVPSTDIKGMSSHKGADTEMVGFLTTGYLDKRDTPVGENAQFNCMPPGMDITNQIMTEQHPMPMKTLVGTSYPGDGWGGSRDIPE
jgi:hypothetical protein